MYYNIADDIIAFLYTGYDPIPTDFSICYSFDLRPGYKDHVYAYATWRIESPVGMCVTMV